LGLRIAFAATQGERTNAKRERPSRNRAESVRVRHADTAPFEDAGFTLNV